MYLSYFASCSCDRYSLSLTILCWLWLLFRPEAFKSKTIESYTRNVPEPASELEAEEAGTSDDDGLPPLEANMNRRRPYELHSASNSDADTDSDEES